MERISPVRNRPIPSTPVSLDDFLFHFGVNPLDIIFKSQHESIVGLPVRESDFGGSFPVSDDVLRKGEKDIPSQYEFDFVSRNHKMIHSFITVGMIPGRKRSIVSIIGILKINYTERALRESEEKFRKPAESLSLGVYIIQDERFIYVNQYIISTFGYSEDEIYSKPFFSFFFY